MTSTRKRRATLLAAIISVLVLVLGVMPALADTGSGVIQGTGTISPGLNVTPEKQEVTFDGTGAIVSDVGQGTISCTFDGESTIEEDLSTGEGEGSLECTAQLVPSGSASASCSVEYERHGSAVTVDGSCSGDIAGSVTAACHFEPDPGLPVTSYRLQCTFAVS